MSEGGGPGAGHILLGIFLCLFGLCITLLGGGCTIMWISMAAESSGYGGGLLALTNPLFIISIAVLVGGVFTIWIGIKFLRGKFQS
jgi:hypothetical protein